MSRYVSKIINLKFAKIDEESRHILLCGDKNYIKYVGVALSSVLINSAYKKWNFHIFLDDIYEKDLAKLNETAEKYKININVYFINFNVIDKFSENMHGNDHISVAAYFRFIAFGALMNICNKVLYLDSDILVTDDISMFWKVPLKDAIAIVVEDDYGYMQTDRLHVKKYFNSGVMFVDIAEWNKYNYSEICIKTASEKVWQFLDQDVLNIVLDGKLVFFPKIYNYQYSISRLIDSCNQLSQDIVLDENKIIHFIGASKPWNSWTQSINAVKQYNVVKNISYWKDNKIIFPGDMKGKKYKYMHKAAIVAKKNDNYKEMVYWYLNYIFSKLKYCFGV